MNIPYAYSNDPLPSTRPEIHTSGCGCASIIIALVIAWNIGGILDCIEKRNEHEQLKARISTLEMKYLEGVNWEGVIPEIEKKRDGVNNENIK